MIAFTLSSYAITPIDDRIESFGTVQTNKIYFADGLNQSYVLTTDFNVMIHKLTENDVISFEGVDYMPYDLPNPNGYIFYTSYLNGKYLLESSVFYWFDYGQEYQAIYDYTAFCFSSIQRSNIDLLEINEGIEFKKIYFSKDSTLNLLPVAQNTDENIHTLIFVFLILLGLILGGYSYVHK